MFVRVLSAKTKPVYQEIDIQNPSLDQIVNLVGEMDGDSVDNTVISCQSKAEFHLAGGKDGKILVSFETTDDVKNMVSGDDTTETEIMAGGQAILVTRRSLIEKATFLSMLSNFAVKGENCLDDYNWE